MYQEMAQGFYAAHYREKIASYLTRDQKESIARRISQLTLKAAIWTDKDKDWIEDFPELKGMVNTTLSGLYLCTIMHEIVPELAGQGL